MTSLAYHSTNDPLHDHSTNVKICWTNSHNTITVIIKNSILCLELGQNNIYVCKLIRAIYFSFHQVSHCTYWLFLIKVVHILHPVHSNTWYITTSGNCGKNVTIHESDQDCLTIDDMSIDGIIESNDIIVFESGIHMLHSPIHIQYVSDIVITSINEATIQCQYEAGFTFFEIRNLSISNISFIHCGLTNSSLKMLQTQIDNAVFTFQLPTTALAIASCDTVSLSHVAINNSTGIGLLAINVMGHLLIHGTNFEGNCYSDCSKGNAAKGGAILLYYQYEGTLNSSAIASTNVQILYTSFNNNHGCTGRNHAHSEEFSKFYHSVGAGGLSFIASQLTYSVHVNIQDSTFIGNNGSGLSIRVPSNNVRVNIRRCTFEDNGQAVKAMLVKPVRPIGGGISIILDSPSASKEHFPVAISNSSFIGNAAFAGGGLYIHSYTNVVCVPYVTIANCTFHNNTATIGASICVIEDKQNGRYSGLQLVLKDISITKSRQLQSFYRSSSVASASASIDIYSINVTMEGLVFVSHGAVTGIKAVDSVVNIVGNVICEYNTGQTAGGLQLVDSIVILYSSSTLSLSHNFAWLYGGGVYIDNARLQSRYFTEICHMYVRTAESELSCACTMADIETQNITVEVMDNYSPWGSDWFVVVPNVCQQNQIPVHSYNDSTYFITWQYEGLVTSISSRLDVLDNEATVFVMPGQLHNLLITAYDAFNQTVLAVVMGSSDADKDNAVVTLGNSGYWLLDGDIAGTALPIIVNGTEGDTVHALIYTLDSFSTATITIHLQQCAPGYYFNESLQSCLCLKELGSYGITCDLDSGTITVPPGTWFGPLDTKSNYTTDNLAVHECVSSLCNVDETVIANGSFDDQCRKGYNRKGVLCGQCIDGFGLTEIGNKCKQCTAVWYYYFLSAITIMLAIIIAISSIELNISSGILNGLIFYDSIGNAFSYELQPGTLYVRPFRVTELARFFNICTYAEISQLHRTLTDLLSPAFLIIVTVVLYVLSKYIKPLSHCGKGFTGTFVSFIIVTYTTIARFCAEILSFVDVETLSGIHQIRWKNDPNVIYFTGLHAASASLAILMLMIFVIPFPIILLFPSKMYTMKCVKYLKPLFDVLWAPFKPRFRFWLGLRLIFRILPITFAYFLTPPINIWLTLMYLNAILILEMLVQPFEGQVQNYLFIFYLSNLNYLFIVALYFHSLPRQVTAHTSIAGALIAVAYAPILPMILYFILKKWPKLKQKLMFTLSFHKIFQNKQSTEPEVDLAEKMERSGRASSTNQGCTDDMSHALKSTEQVMYTVFREPLLEEGELSVEQSFCLKRTPTSSIKKKSITH